MYKQMADFWIDLMFWWVPKQPRAIEPIAAAPVPSQSTEDKPVPLVSEPTEATEQAPERVAADLTIIKGIGPALQKKLAAMNILTFGDLADADPDMLTSKLKGSQPISAEKVRAWTQSARALAQA